MFAKAFIALTVAAAALAQTITLNTPVLAQCIPVQITWTGGTAPYTLAVQDGANPSQTIVFLGSNLSGTSYSWAPVNLQAGRSVSLRITDSVGAFGQTAAVTIQGGTTDSCLNATASTSVSGVVSTTITSGSATGSSSGTSGTSSASRTTTSGSSTTSGSAASSGSTTSRASTASASATSSAAATSPSSGAQVNFGQAIPAVVGAVAVGLAALF